MCKLHAVALKLTSAGKLKLDNFWKNEGLQAEFGDQFQSITSEQS